MLHDDIFCNILYEIIDKKLGCILFRFYRERFGWMINVEFKSNLLTNDGTRTQF